MSTLTPDMQCIEIVHSRGELDRLIPRRIIKEIERPTRGNSCDAAFREPAVGVSR